MDDLFRKSIEDIPSIQTLSLSPTVLKYSTKRRQSSSCNISAVYYQGNRRCFVKICGKLARIEKSHVALILSRETVDAVRALERAVQTVFWETNAFLSVIDGAVGRWRARDGVAFLGTPPEIGTDVTLVVELLGAFFDDRKARYGLNFLSRVITH